MCRVQSPHLTDFSSVSQVSDILGDKPTLTLVLPKPCWLPQLSYSYFRLKTSCVRKTAVLSLSVIAVSHYSPPYEISYFFKIFFSLNSHTKPYQSMWSLFTWECIAKSSQGLGKKDISWNTPTLALPYTHPTSRQDSDNLHSTHAFQQLLISSIILLAKSKFVFN